MSFHDEIISKFEFLTKKPENFLSAQNNIADDVTKLLKSLYDHTKNTEEQQSVNALPELIIDRFDEEQIWQELELQNDETSGRFVRDVAHLVAAKNSLVFPVEHPSVSGSELEDSDDGGSDVGSGERTNHSDSEDTELPENPSSKENATTQRSKRVHTGKSSIVDDQFFKLNELEDFLMREDRRFNKESKKTQDSSESGSDDESVDYFQDVPSDDDNKDEEDLCYADFFDAPEDYVEENKRNGYEDNEIHSDDKNSEEDKDDDSNDGDSKSGDKLKRVRFEKDHSDDAEESASDGRYVSTKGSKASETKSSFESRQERIRSKVDELEAKALQEKPWQLKGEVSATTRPKNSLLEEVLEFDLTTRPAPIITEETTFKLEDIIRQRIKDKAWDDVEKKVKPVETPFEYKKKLVLNQEKSKLSLAEVYEQEYLKQRESLNPEVEEKPEEEPESHKEIKKMMSSLFVKLDALSNFHYTPKPVAPDIQIISNLPAITIEEVAPVGVSDGVLLAPEEVKAKKKGELMGKDERSETDKKRERRKKKLRQREHHREQEKRKKAVEKLRPGLGNKYSKQKAMKMLEKATKDKNVSVLEEKSKAVKTSKAFFRQLQDEVDVHIKSKLKSTKRKKDDKTVSAKKIKL